MLADVLPYLRCPLCRLELVEHEAAVRCPQGHSFDRARQGYVHLTAEPVGHTGDSAAMVEARAAFLSAGRYDFIADALVKTVPSGAGLVIDVGAGTGRHLAAVLDAHPRAIGLAVDVATAVLNVFAPRNGPEFARVLAPDGLLIVVTPTSDHMGELVAALGLLTVDPDKEERIAASLTPWFVERAVEIQERSLELSRAEVAGLVGMGPSAWHLDPGELSARIAPLPEPVSVTARVRVSTYSQVPLGF